MPNNDVPTNDVPTNDVPTNDVPTNEQRRAAAKRKLQQQQERQAAAAKKRRLFNLIGAGVALIAAVALIITFVLTNITSRSSEESSDTTTNATTDTTDTTPASTPADAATTPTLAGLPSFTASADLGTNCTYPATSQPASRSVTPPKNGKVPTSPATVSASMATNQGNIGLQLNNAQSPCTVNNFASLAQKGFFDDTPCHRLTTSTSLSVLQCGDPTGTGSGGPGYQFANEYPTNQYPEADPALGQPLTYPRGTLAMANAGADTNGSQFFLVYQDSQLPPNYTVFGTIDETGLDTLDRIAEAGVAGGSQDGAPATDVQITSILLD